MMTGFDMQNSTAFLNDRAADKDGQMTVCRVGQTHSVAEILRRQRAAVVLHRQFDPRRGGLTSENLNSAVADGAACQGRQ